RALPGEPQAAAPAPAAEPGSPRAPFPDRDGRSPPAAQVLPIPREMAERVRDEDLAGLVDVSRSDLFDAPVVCARRGVRLADELDLAGYADSRERLLHLVVRGQRDTRERHGPAFAAAVC